VGQGDELVSFGFHPLCPPTLLVGKEQLVGERGTEVELDFNFCSLNIWPGTRSTHVKSISNERLFVAAFLGFVTYFAGSER
jgi:hypothetical protein